MRGVRAAGEDRAAVAPRRYDSDRDTRARRRSALADRRLARRAAGVHAGVSRASGALCAGRVAAGRRAAAAITGRQSRLVGCARWAMLVGTRCYSLLGDVEGARAVGSPAVDRT